jgi:hypothetical protein
MSEVTAAMMSAQMQKLQSSVQQLEGEDRTRAYKNLSVIANAPHSLELLAPLEVFHPGELAGPLPEYPGSDFSIAGPLAEKQGGHPRQIDPGTMIPMISLKVDTTAVTTVATSVQCPNCGHSLRVAISARP